MPLRIRNYADNVHMEHWRGKRFRSTDRNGPSGSGRGLNRRMSTPATRTREIRSGRTPRDSTNRALSGFCTIVCDRDRRKAQPSAERRIGRVRRAFTLPEVSALHSPVRALTATGTRVGAR